MFENIDKLKENNADGKIVYDLFMDRLRTRLREGKDKEKVLVLFAKALENYRHVRFVDAFLVFEVVCG